MPLEYNANRGWTHFEAQFAQFTFQFVIAQSGVIPRHAENPLLQFGVNGRTSWLTFLLECPLAPHKFTMPADDRRWLEHSYTVLQRLARMDRFLFQPQGQGYQRYFLSAWNRRTSLLFSFDDPQLLTQQ